MLRFGPIACAAAFLTLAGPGLAGPLGRDGAGADGVGIDGYARMVRPEVPERAGSRQVKLGVNKSLVVELPLDAKDILVSNPKIADAVLRTSRRAFLIGMEAGQTNIVFFDAGGQQILGLDLQVERDLAALAAMLRKVLPASDIQPEGVGDGVALTGVVANAADAQEAVEVAARYVGDEKKVVNALTTKGGEQVLLKVTVAEVQRTIVKQLGIDLSGQTNIGSVVLNAGTSNPFMIAGKVLPAGTANEAAAQRALPEIRATLARAGIGPEAIEIRAYGPAGAAAAPIRLSYAALRAQTNMCGLWPDDLQGNQQNRSYYNFGCATQQNLAAMVKDPADLVSPQPETRPYATRRQEVLGKYGKGDDPSTTYKDAAKGNSSKVGQ